MRGLSGRALRFAGRRPFGLADWADYAAALGLEDCGAYTTVSGQYACSQRNQEKQNAYYAPDSELYAERHGGVTPAELAYNLSYAAQLPGGNWQCSGSTCVNQDGAVRTVTAPAIQTTAAPPPPPPAVYRPVVTFATSRGGMTAYPGDTWTVRIVGAAPRSAVYVEGGKNGAVDRNRMGDTDSAGGFFLSGSFSASEIGAWSERWIAGDVDAGNFAFVVVARPADPAPPPPGAGSGAGAGNGGDTGGAGSGWLSGETSIGGLTIPNWGFLAAGGVGALLLLRGGR